MNFPAKVDNYNKMGKHKAWCSKCNKRHFPPTGKKYHKMIIDDMVLKAKTKSGVIDGRGSQPCKSKVNRSMSLHGQSSITQKQEFHVKRAFTPGREDQSDNEGGSDSADGGSASLQLRILDALKKVSNRLDVMEQKVGDGGQR